MSDRNASSKFTYRRKVLLGRLAVPVVLLLLWELAAALTSDFALVSPLIAFETVVHGLYSDGWMVEDFQTTLFTLAIAYVIAVFSGLWVGVMLGLNQFWKEVFEPPILGIYSIPKITLFPIFLFLFGIGVDSMVAFGWFHGVFPVLILTMSAMGTINDTHLKVSASLGLSSWQRFREVIVPSILPGMVIGMRLGFSLTFLGIIIGEMFAARSGMGHELILYMETVQVDRILAIITVLIVIAAIVNGVFYYIEKRLEQQSGADGEAVRM